MGDTIEFKCGRSPFFPMLLIRLPGLLIRRQGYVFSELPRLDRIFPLLFSALSWIGYN
jgi:hypothetical protein